MTDVHPFFSVLVPSYNQAPYLGAALDSLLAQTDPDWEAVAVNDGSTDATQSILDAYGRRDRRIRVIRQENGGTARALNMGLAHARGTWICWLSSDDLFDPRKLAVHRVAIARAPSSRFFYTGYRLLHEQSGTITDGPSDEVTSREWQVLGLFKINYIAGNSICVHREVFERGIRFDERLRYAHDHAMWLRLMALYPATYLPERTSIVRLHPRQTQRRVGPAVLFDGARSAINFLNDHTFMGLFPMVDLADRRMALQATARALVVAADPVSWLYSLGPHTALVSRVLEWLSCRTCPVPAETARQLVGFFASQVERLHAGTLFAEMWRAVPPYVDPGGSGVRYQFVAPVSVAGATYERLRTRESWRAKALRRYMIEQLGHGASLDASPGSQLDFLPLSERGRQGIVETS